MCWASTGDIRISLPGIRTTAVHLVSGLRERPFRGCCGNAKCLGSPLWEALRAWRQAAWGCFLVARALHLDSIP